MRLGVVPLHTYAAEDFPRLPEIDPESAFTVDREAFVDTIARVGRSASRDESRPVLTGVLVRFEGDKLVMAATDSYRLSVKETALRRRPRPASSRRSCRRGRSRSSRIGRAARADDLVGVQENQVVFGVDGVWLTARRIDGQFPNYKQLLPEKFEAEVDAAARGVPRRRPPHGPRWRSASRRSASASRRAS